MALIRSNARTSCAELAAAVILLGSSAIILNRTGQSASAAPPARVADARSLERSVNEALGLRASHVAAIRVGTTPQATVTAVVPINGEVHALELTPHSVRSVGYQLLVQLENGSYQRVPPGASRTYRGKVPGIAGSAVAASLESDGLHARVVLPNGGDYWVEPLAGRVAGADVQSYVVYHTDDIVSPMSTCDATEDMRPPAGEVGQTASVGGGCGGDVCVAEIACDADVEYYRKWGNVWAVENRISSIINAVNVQYERDVSIRHDISTIVVRTGDPDPYVSSDAYTMLTEVRSQWNTYHENVPRDVVQMFTGKELAGSTIGIAWLGSICGGFGYSVVQSDFNGNFGSATDLSSHELGHSWNAGHCTCSSPTAYTMNPYITSANRFHPDLTIPSIDAFLNSRSCLTADAACSGDVDCDDGRFCNGAETCRDGACEPGTPPCTEDDGINCTRSACDEAADACAQVVDNEQCDNGMFCDGEEWCDPTFGCRAGSDVDCDDGIACTTDSCDESASRCVHTANHGACDNGLYCDGVEVCDAKLGCQSGFSPCQGLVACDEERNSCGGCSSNAECDDGRFCNGTERCLSGLCLPGRSACSEGEQCDENNDACIPGVCVEDGVCAGDEDCHNCPRDCFSGVGAVCGNNICEIGGGENCLNCPRDCASKLSGTWRDRYCCGYGASSAGSPSSLDADSVAAAVGCEDARCAVGGRTCSNEPIAPTCCGDGVCEGWERPCNCAVDCGAPPEAESTCDNAIDEDCDGRVDCDDSDCSARAICAPGPNCGNGRCDPGENCRTCPGDCRGNSQGRLLYRFCCGDGLRQPLESRFPNLCNGNN